jgi:hypothetical protein
MEEHTTEGSIEIRKICRMKFEGKRRKLGER